MVMTVAVRTPKEPAQGPLEGEDIETEHWEDARHWMSIYDDLIRFKLGLLELVTRELPKLHPVAQNAAKVDVTFIENQMAGRVLRPARPLVPAGLETPGSVARSKRSGTTPQRKRGGTHPSRVRALAVPPRRYVGKGGGAPVVIFPLGKTLAVRGEFS
jgi:hypothetical protein